MTKSAEAPPVLDFTAYYSGDAAAKKKLVADVRSCCLRNGFFQIIGHPIPTDLQIKIMGWNKKFFDMSMESKMKLAKGKVNVGISGYQKPNSQMHEFGATPELKESFYISEEPLTGCISHSTSTSNTWPSEEDLPDIQDFRVTSMDYFYRAKNLAGDILNVLALTLDLEESFFDEFAEGSVASLRFLHYPAQEPDAPANAREIGAHTDFGAVTILLQDEVPGLQVYSRETKEWVDVLPTAGALVVNLGNLIMRWSNDRYISNLHRVINISGKERYSIPFFYSGSADFVIKCLPNCRKEGEEPKYSPITVHEAVMADFNRSYENAVKFKEAAEKSEASAPA